MQGTQGEGGSGMEDTHSLPNILFIFLIPPLGSGSSVQFQRCLKLNQTVCAVVRGPQA